MSLSSDVGPEVYDFLFDRQAGLPVPSTDPVYRRDAMVIGQSHRNQLLPLDWTHLSKVDLFEIRKILEKPLGLPNIVEPEAKLAIAAILTTGRKLKDLRRLKIVESENDLDVSASGLEGLIWNEREVSWRFIAGTSDTHVARARMKAAKEGGKQPERESASQNFVYIHVEVAALVQDCIRQFPNHFSPLHRLAHGPTKLFTSGDKILRQMILHLLDTRRPPGCGRPRATSRTVASLERFLTRAMAHEYGGDLVGAMRLTGRQEAVGRTPNYYGATLVSNALRTANRANAIILGEVDAEGYTENQFKDYQKVGSSNAPVWAEVRTLAEACQRFLARNAGSPLLAHKAMTYQTAALLSFAIGHRGEGEALPSSSAIDPVTGFCKLHDKMRDDVEAARMVWVPEVARQQIRAYENHLENLGDLIDESELEKILDTVRNGRLALFSIDDGIPMPLRFRTLWEEMSKELDLWRPLSSNAGRHWLHSVLTGRCSSDTIRAFFGHWLTGGEPWSFASCLDPLLFRSELRGALPYLLEKTRWQALDAKGQIA